MTENWSIIDFKDLMKSILNGNRCIQDPISVSNKRRDTVSNTSFLNLLLSYNNVAKDNILDVLANIYGRFHNRINELKENKIVQNMMDCINQEWYDPDYMFITQYPFSDNFFDKNLENKPMYERSCKVCEEIKNLSTIEHNIPLKIEKEGVHPLDKHFTQGIGICKTSIETIEKNLQEINNIIDQMKKEDMTQFMDLSIKHKSLYLKLSDKDEDDESIPENIHRIFSNYYHIHNLLLKQLIQYYHFILHLLNELKERCQTLENLQQNVHAIAYFDEEEEEEEDDGGEDSQLLVQDGEIYSRDKESNENDSAVQKFLSFF
tara:strand:+ start:386 stop:1342 length:957 start_codon:yes stop_codon:yes gene_type:complete